MGWKPKSCGTKTQRRGLQKAALPKAACGIWVQGDLSLDAHEGTCAKTSTTHYRRKIHTPSNLVVAHWPSEVESTAPLDFLLRHGLWTPFGCPMSCKIRSIISATCDFTTKFDGVWQFYLSQRDVTEPVVCNFEKPSSLEELFKYGLVDLLALEPCHKRLRSISRRL